MSDRAPPVEKIEAVRPRGGRVRKLARTGAFLVGLAAIVASGLYFVFPDERFIETDNAYVRAMRVTVGPEVAGRIASLSVDENQLVKAGDELFRLNQASFEIALAKASADLAATRNQIEAMRAAYRRNLEDQRMAEANIAFADRDHRRQATLASSQFVSEAKLDEARNRLDGARSKLAALRLEGLRLLAELSGNASLLPEDHPIYRAALERQRQAAFELEQTIVRAPFDAHVGRADSVRIGAFVKAGSPVLPLVEARHVWIEANLKETQLTRVRHGQPAKVTVDTFPGLVWDAEVESVSPATGAEYSVLPAQNASGNWVKVVQRIPVRIRVIQDPAKPHLRMGMSAQVAIDTGQRDGLLERIVAVCKSVLQGLT